MFWLAMHFSALPLEIFSRGGAAPGPIAVIEKQGNRSRVKVCDKAASELGVRPGMQGSAARALVTDLIVRSRDISAENESLTGLAAWAGSFTPDVSLQPPDGLLIEIGSCLRLHRGFRNLITQMRNGLNEMGYTASLACAPTPHAAWLMALAGRQVAIRESGKLERVLGELPVSVLDQSRDTLASLEMVGAHTLGDCMQFPRGGMARRFGQSLLDELDRALGRLPEAREFFVPPPGFERRLELPTQVHEVEALLFAVRRLLLELEGYLSLRQAGIQELVLVCSHEDVPDTALKIGFAQPTRDLNRMLLLARDTLVRTRLPAPVHTILLKAGFIQTMELSNLDLFRDSAETRDSAKTGDGNLLLERLRIRLGKEAVFSITHAADHRPELAWRQCDTGEEIPSPGRLQRPLWLLPKPLPCRKDRLELESGPERIESGWWDGMDVVRDYYVAQGRNGSRLWVFRDRTSDAWFVHGLFA
ncbi:MAG: DNA polymerase Y family protein [Gallionella sp.]